MANISNDATNRVVQVANTAPQNIVIYRLAGQHDNQAFPQQIARRFRPAPRSTRTNRGTGGLRADRRLIAGRLQTIASEILLRLSQ